MARKPKTIGALSDLQERFCREYILDLNATQAAIRAGYSPKTAQEQSSDLLSRPIVSSRVEALLAARNERTAITADTILQELRKIALSDIGEAFDESGQLKPIKEIPKEIRQAISSVESIEQYEGSGRERKYIGELKKVKFWEKTKALEMLGRHLKLFTDKVEHSGTVSLAQLVEGSVKENNEH